MLIDRRDAEDAEKMAQAAYFAKAAKARERGPTETSGLGRPLLIKAAATSIGSGLPSLNSQARRGGERSARGEAPGREGEGWEPWKGEMRHFLSPFQG